MKKRTPEEWKAFGRQGGLAAHEQGVAHEWTKAEAREAGRKGGHAIAAIPGHMERIGKLGGLARARNARARKEREDKSGHEET